MSSARTSPNSAKHLVENKLHSLRSSNNEAKGASSVSGKGPFESKQTSKDLKRPLYAIKESDFEEYGDDTLQALDKDIIKPDNTDLAYEADLEEDVASALTFKRKRITANIPPETTSKSFNEKEYIYKVSW